MSGADTKIITHLLAENGSFPNNGRLPLVLIRQVADKNTVTPELFESSFNSNSWPAAWRNGLYPFHHYHSTAHEVLGVYSGWVQACFGGPGGPTLKAEAGDVIIIPAGLSHCNQGQSSDFSVVGGYPVGQPWDMQYGKQGERPQTDHNIDLVPLPVADPVSGANGPLMSLWL